MIRSDSIRFECFEGLNDSIICGARAPESYQIFPVNTDISFIYSIIDNSDLEPDVNTEIVDFQGNSIYTNIESGTSRQIPNNGLYTFIVTATDDAGNTASAEVTFVVYDPSASFATGGGWITPVIPANPLFFYVFNLLSARPHTLICF